jgi:hypothetical protein
LLWRNGLAFSTSWEQKKKEEGEKDFSFLFLDFSVLYQHFKRERLCQRKTRVLQLRPAYGQIKPVLILDTKS